MIDILGKGAFGQVARCIWKEGNQEIALKVIKNKTAYYNLAKHHEVVHLQELNDYEDKKSAEHKIKMRKFLLTESESEPFQRKIIKKLEHFESFNHLFLVFELLDISVYDVLKETQYNGFTFPVIQKICIQVLEGLDALYENKIIHSDLKPENILFNTPDDDFITIIDLGSSCKSNTDFFEYIQSRFYRAPEVILGLKYGMEIDMWSFGCFAAELYIGLPLFHGNNEYDQLRRIIGACGMPSLEMIMEARNKKKFFNFGGNGKISLKTMEQFAKDNKIFLEPSKSYHSVNELVDLDGYYSSSKLRETGNPEDRSKTEVFIHFIGKILRMVPRERMTPKEALRHPFITNDMKSFEEIKRQEKKESLSLAALYFGPGGTTPNSAPNSGDLRQQPHQYHPQFPQSYGPPVYYQQGNHPRTHEGVPPPYVEGYYHKIETPPSEGRLSRGHGSPVYSYVYGANTESSCSSYSHFSSISSNYKAYKDQQKSHSNDNNMNKKKGPKIYNGKHQSQRKKGQGNWGSDNQGGWGSNNQGGWAPSKQGNKRSSNQHGGSRENEQYETKYQPKDKFEGYRAEMTNSAIASQGSFESKASSQKRW